MAGDSRAQFFLGHFYEIGPIPTRDPAKAAEWYRKAANQGDAPAQDSLGYLCRYGLGIPKDQEAATAWFLKAANQGDPFGERDLALQYYRGDGIHQSDRDAYAWFYSSAQQDDPVAEHYLGVLYRDGRGVTRNDQAAFAWYYRSAQNDNVYGEWGLAYMYERGRGVTKDLEESLKWYHKAQAGLPENEDLKKDIALASLKTFLENRDSASFDPSLIMTAFRRQILSLFFCLVAAYALGSLLLLYSTFRAPDAGPRLWVAIGWLIFYMESQGVALLTVFIFGKSLTADTLMIALSFFALPVIASSCGPNRNRIWKASQLSWKTLLLYGAGSCLVIVMVELGFNQIYTLITHSPLPSQSTEVLILKAKQASAGLAYLSIALILPATEEIIFRSYLFDALRRRFSEKIVVILTAVAFSLAHFQSLYFVPLFGFGLVLGWLRLRTHSLRLPVLLHAINNAVSLTFAV